MEKSWELSPTFAAVTSGHTPGPWRDGQDGNLRVYGPDGMGEHSGLIAVVYKGRANARLIAAAPDLLAVAKMMLATDDEWKALSMDERSRVEAAIAKATSSAEPAVDAVPGMPS